jgi:DNA-binding XRE family transcriptional regulator
VASNTTAERVVGQARDTLGRKGGHAMSLSTFIVTPDGTTQRANQLRLAREQAGLSQVELARHARVGRRTVQRYERNGHPQLTEELVRVVATLNAARMLNGKAGA